ncbi:MAG TPA: GIY-YIG nuclease family protein, partial [Phormidium sp.]
MKAVVNQQSIGIIYQAYNTLTKKSYVGQTVKDLATRRSRHYSSAKTKKYKFAQALKKYAEKY